LTVGPRAALAHGGRTDEASHLLTQLPPDVTGNVLNVLRHAPDRELVREGLRRAGAAL
jgi:hypothetical protein